MALGGWASLLPHTPPSPPPLQPLKSALPFCLSHCLITYSPTLQFSSSFPSLSLPHLPNANTCAFSLPFPYLAPHLQTFLPILFSSNFLPSHLYTPQQIALFQLTFPLPPFSPNHLRLPPLPYHFPLIPIHLSFPTTPLITPPTCFPFLPPSHPPLPLHPIVIQFPSSSFTSSPALVSIAPLPQTARPPPSPPSPLLPPLSPSPVLPRQHPITLGFQFYRVIVSNYTVCVNIY